jgi:bloom syndrome protein
MTPEKLSQNQVILNGIKRLYKNQMLNFIAIDEAHCVSIWGHEFRQDFLWLSNLKELFPSLPILALTATATEMVKEDVIRQLKMENTFYFQSTFNRPNLFYEVVEKKPKKQSIEDLCKLLHFRFLNESGIIYCSSIKDTNEIAEKLKSKGIKAGVYHGKLSFSQRSHTHSMWKNGFLKIVVATIAFGMGIDKADVRFVIHFSFSKVYG